LVRQQEQSVKSLILRPAVREKNSIEPSDENVPLLGEKTSRVQGAYGDTDRCISASPDQEKRHGNGAKVMQNLKNPVELSPGARLREKTSAFLKGLDAPLWNNHPRVKDAQAALKQAHAPSHAYIAVPGTKICITKDGLRFGITTEYPASESESAPEHQYRVKLLTGVQASKKEGILQEICAFESPYRPEAIDSALKSLTQTPKIYKDAVFGMKSPWLFVKNNPSILAALPLLPLLPSALAANAVLAYKEKLTQNSRNLEFWPMYAEDFARKQQNAAAYQRTL
jgi:hypothetical protein